MATISEFNEVMNHVNPVDYQLLLVNHVRSELTKDYPTHIHVGKGLFYWLSELVGTPDGTFDGKVRVYVDNLERYIDVFLDYQRPDEYMKEAVGTQSLSVLLAQFENGEERFYADATFRMCIESISRGVSVYKVLDNVLKNRQELIDNLNKEVREGNGTVPNNG